MKTLSRAFMVLVFGILYIPMMVLVLFSFNKDNSTGSFGGFSLRWYVELFSNSDAFVALRNTLILAVCSAAIATVIGTLASVGMHKMKNKALRSTVSAVNNIPMMNPEIVTGISMMLLFVFVGGMLHLSNSLSFWTMLIAHTTFNLPYVTLSVLPKFRQMDKHLTEAALDLGCTPAQTFFRVELPCILPGMLSGLMMSFTLSLDDFVISHFVSSPDFKTLPLYIYNQTAHEVKFSMYALCSLMIVVILVLLIAVNVAGSVGEKRQKKDLSMAGGRT